MTKPVEWIAGLTIGTIESVSPAEFTVVLDLEAPQATALNTGSPTAFPRINGYVLVAGQAGSIVGQITWLGIERSPFPKRPGLKDFGLVDLPYPLRKMHLTPIGTLTASRRVGAAAEFGLERGVSSFPSVGDAVSLPSLEEIRGIVESTGKDARVEIGRSPLARGARISIDPDKLFGRHTAVLGNTGSGKSCTVAGLIRWSLQEARRTLPEGAKPGRTNSRFIVLDPNGEYRKAFQDFGDEVRVLQVVPDTSGSDGGSQDLFKIPAWMWNAQEWFAFTSAAPKTQQPMLMQALHNLRTGGQATTTPEKHARALFSTYRVLIKAKIAAGPPAYAEFPALKGCHNILQRMCDDLSSSQVACQAGAIKAALDDARNSTLQMLDSRCNVSKGTRYEQPLSEKDLQDVVEKLNAITQAPKPAADPKPVSSPQLRNPDSPLRFDLAELPDQLDLVAELEPGTAQHVSFLSFRIRSLLADGRIRPVIDPEGAPTLAEWLTEFLPGGDGAGVTINVLDLSLVPSEVVHVLVSAAARLLFEGLQRHRRQFGKELPTVIVLEEAHSFVHEGSDDANEVPTASQMCRRTFEKIAREGRKFGLGLVLSSQRPSELSQTVLAQCNTFVLHRLVNDRDQDYVRRLVPDLLGGIFAELPSLPSQHAILLGWASPVPKLVRINDLPFDQRPNSADPEFWDVWTRKGERATDWTLVASSWTGTEESPDVEEQEPPEDAEVGPSESPTDEGPEEPPE
ncbi:MAG: DUF87 domain-containing protein [Planctomycetia bacterium]|nr:DUF87 domain-containing protein [Planctomycetia bacterium]